MTTNEADILRALVTLEEKLTIVINTGLDKLQTAQHIMQLDQAKLNSTFADRDRVEAIARSLHDVTNACTVNNLQLSKLELADTKLAADLATLTATMNSRNYRMLSTVAGYLVTALLMIAVALLTFVLSHMGHF